MTASRGSQLVVMRQPFAKSTQDHCSIDPVTYDDTFTLSGLDDSMQKASAEQWARAALGNKPNWSERVIWSGLLRFNLHREASQNTVAGWRIGSRGGDEWIRLDNSSWLMDANIVVSKARGQVSFSTILRYKSIAGRFLWSTLGFVHRWAVPRLLRAGAQRIHKVR